MDHTNTEQSRTGMPRLRRMGTHHLTPPSEGSSLNGSGHIREQVPHSTAGRSATNFECDLCARAFTTKSGLGLHKKRAHVQEMNDCIDLNRVRKRWSVEETRLLASTEANLLVEGCSNLVPQLQLLFPHRTVDAIKGQRKKAEHKALVAEFFESTSHQQTNSSNGDTVLDPNEMHDLDISTERIKEAIQQNVEALNGSSKRIALDICNIARDALDGGDIGLLMNALTSWFKTLYPHSKRPKGPIHGLVENYSGNSNQRRRQRYAKLQKLIKKDTKAAARLVLNDQDLNAMTLPDPQAVISYWKQVFSSSNSNVGSHNTSFIANDELEPIWSPVTIEEVKLNLLDKTSAPGLDGVLPKQWNRMDPAIKVLLFNLFMWLECTPETLKKFRTILIPKQAKGSTDPGDFRPITISSSILRQFHSIIAKRIVKCYAFDNRQKGFLPVDGTAKSTLLLNTLLYESRTQLRELHVILVDAAKAFDSVEHKAIIETLVRKRFPIGFIKYVQSSYSNARTLIQYQGKEEMSSIQKGVLQGDPLSALIFNLGLESVLNALSKDVGFDVQGYKINANAYADDGMLVSCTVVGGQSNLDRYVKGLDAIGLTVNPQKSSVLSVVPSGRDKKTKVVPTATFKVNGQYLPQISISDLFKYLGITYEGHDLANAYEIDGSLYNMLSKIDKAPLKPQQRLKMLRMNVIPKVMHKLILGRAESRKLKLFDKHVKTFVRKWLHLPHDSPNAFFYAPVKGGGLGILCMQQFVPLCKFSRYSKLLRSEDEETKAIASSQFVQRELSRCKMQLSKICSRGEQLDKNQYHKYWRDQLYSSCDGRDFKETENHKSSCSWIDEKSGMVSSGDFIQYLQVRLNTLPSRARLARGRPDKEQTCRAGCGKIETQYHIIQECFRTHGGRVFRHDRVVDILADDFARKKIAFRKTNVFRTRQGIYKPDLVIISNDVATVIDAQVVKSSVLDESHQRKVNKYRNVQGLTDIVKTSLGVEEVRYTSCTISYKGIWSKQSVDSLKKLRVSEFTLFKIVTSVLRGSYLNWLRFNQMTMSWGSRGRS